MRTAAARPQPPRQLEVADADAGHLLLRWAPGCDDGGAPVLGYRVQVMPSKPHASLELYKPAGGHGNSDVDVGDADEGTHCVRTLNMSDASLPAPGLSRSMHAWHDRVLYGRAGVVAYLCMHVCMYVCMYVCM
ncbi:ybeQ [Symbiodinium microadriaticum]|nr:ybeQ [Symbiodinium microadriaticum]